MEQEKDSNSGKFTPREKELCGHIVTGLKLRQAAGHMNISENTAKKMMRNMHQKTKVDGYTAFVLHLHKNPDLYKD